MGAEVRKWGRAIALAPVYYLLNFALVGAFVGVTVAWAQTAPPGVPADLFAELWNMVKVAGPVASAIIWYLWRRDQARFDTDRAELKAIIAKLQDEKDAMQERTLTTLRDSRDSTVMVAEKLAEQTELFQAFFEVIKTALEGRKT